MWTPPPYVAIQSSPLPASATPVTQAFASEASDPSASSSHSTRAESGSIQPPPCSGVPNQTWPAESS